MGDLLRTYIFVIGGGRTPEYADEGSSGADVFARIDKDITIPPGGRELVPAGIVLELPEGYEVQVRPRSGMAIKHGITVLNTPGTVDSSYRGEVGVILINHSDEPFVVTPGLRIAQIVCAKVVKMAFFGMESVEDLSETERGSGGFGHTGQ